MANYEIPWAPPDYSAALNRLGETFRERRASDRADEYARMQREAMDRSEKRLSAEEVRKAEALKHQQAIERFTAAPNLRRMARQSVPMANDNPYNLKFDEGYDLPSNVEGPEMSPAAEAARFAIGAPKAGAPAPAVPRDNSYGYDTGPQATAMGATSNYDPSWDAAHHYAATAHGFVEENDASKDTFDGNPDHSDYLQYALEPRREMQPNGYQGGGIDSFSDKSRQITAENIAGVGQGMGARPPQLAGVDTSPQAPEPPPSAIAAQTTLAGPMGKHRIYEVGSQGERFELPEQSDKTPFGPESDSIYQGLLEAGEDPHKAMQYVAAQYKANQTQEHIAKRTAENTAALIGGRDHAREDTQNFNREENEKYKLTFDQRKTLTNIMARAKAAAAGAGPVSPGLAKLVGMKEQGASDEEIYAEAAKLHMSQKEVTTPVQNVVRNAAAGERAGQKREALTATDEHGAVIGTWKDSTAARTGAKQTESFARVQTRLQELIDDVAHTGNRVLTPEEIQQRVSKGESVVAALRPYNELGSTDASVKMESAIVGALGAPGHGFLMGANPSILQRLLKEAKDQHHVQLNTKLRPGGGSHLAPVLGGKRQGAGGGQVDAARKWLADNPDADPALRAKVEAKIHQLGGGGG